MEVVSVHKTKLFNTYSWWLKDPRNVQEAVRINQWLLYDVSDYLKTQEMCNEVIKKALWLLFDVLDRFRNLGMSIWAIHPLRLLQVILRSRGCVKELLKKNPWQLKDVSVHFKMDKMCERAVEKNPWCLKE